MHPFSLRRTCLLVWFAEVALGGTLGCLKTTPSNSPEPKDGSPLLLDGGSGGNSGAGGKTSGTGGNSGAGGSPIATGGVTGTGGATTGAGGSGIGTGGSTSGTGGSLSDAAPADAGADRAGDTSIPEAGPEIQPPRDGGKESATDASDAPLANQDSAAADGGINVPDGYKLVWSDEFNTDGTPDPKNWNYEKGFVRNNELQWYQSNNATVKAGVLVIEGRREQVANTNYVAGSADWRTNRQYAQYTSTSMTTSGLQTWQYGRFEMRARIPTSAGMWPAWWTLGVSGEWPSNGEIDIMEYYKGNVLANVACGTATQWSAKWDSAYKAVSSLGANWSSNFHIWRMDWDDQNINLYLDDVLMNGVPLSTMLNSDGTSPFKQKDYMLLNLAIGGVNGGDPAATTFPVRYEVDYVRVFQKL